MAIIFMNNSFFEFNNVDMLFHDDKGSTINVLENICFELKKGDFLSILGPSGCGKSTILRLAAGLESPTNGTVLMDGVKISGPNRKRGIVFQSYSVFPWLTVRQNIAFGLQKQDIKEINKKVDIWLDITGLKSFANAYPKILSGGMRQRLALARTMIVEPELLLLDEPFGALDERTRANMQMLLQDIASKSGSTVIFVTHDIQEAILMADKVILLSQRPARILNILSINNKKPRHREYIKSEEFIGYYEALLNQFPT